MYFISRVVFVLLMAVLIIPNASLAYVTTKQTSIRLNENNILFLVSYKFGHTEFSHRLPMAAVRGVKNANAVSFDILSEGKLRTNVGNTMSIVLSNASVENGKYLVEKGASKEFTLLTLLTLPEGRTSSTTDYGLAVSALPFEIGYDTRGYQPNKLNESELKYFRAPVVSTVD
jgi:hypothetical protein